MGFGLIIGVSPKEQAKQIIEIVKALNTVKAVRSTLGRYLQADAPNPGDDNQQPFDLCSISSSATGVEVFR
jgi:hypothetical protein